MSADILFLYDQVTEHLVRLRWFANAVDNTASDPVSDDLDHVAELIVKRDLLVFAASLRNLADATNSVSHMKKIGSRLSEPTKEEPNYHRETDATVSLYQLLSRILHAHHITIVRHPVLLFKWDEVVETHQEVFSARRTSSVLFSSCTLRKRARRSS